MTNPFVGAPTKRPGDIEGVAADPVRNTIWLADDSKFQLYELDYVTGTLLQTVTTAMLAATPRYQISSPPSGSAGVSRAGDLEAIAYDATNDQLFVFAGPCCPPAKPHDPTVFRLTRGVSGHFSPESYQPLPAVGPLNDFSGVGAINGQLWAGLDQSLHRYDYATNTFLEQVGPFSMGGTINGVGFSSDARDVWVTASNDRLYRFAWPGLDLLPDYDFSMVELGLLDTRAVEIVGDEILLADGYDFYPAGTPDEYALRIYKIGASKPTAAFTSAPGVAPLSVVFRDTSTDRPRSWRWDFGDGTTSALQHPQHVFASTGTYNVKLTVTNPNGSSTFEQSTLVGTQPPLAGGSYVGVNPARLLDTRDAPTIDARFAGLGPLGPGKLIDLSVVGRGGVPATGVSAAVLNVTATGASEDSYMTVWPRGEPRPTASNLNYRAGATTPNLVMVPLGRGGAVSLFNETGSTHVIVDVLGYVLLPAAGAAGVFQGLSPARLIDTRGADTIDGLFRARAVLGAKEVRQVTVTGRGGVPASGAGSVALNVTVAAPTAASYLTVWPTGQERPTASNLNFRAGQTIPNMVIVPLGADGQISVFNAAGSTDVLIDVLGWFPQGTGFNGLSPRRLADTRAGGTTFDGAAQAGGGILARAVRTVLVSGRGGVPTAGVGSVALNITAVDPTSASYLTVWPTGLDRPTASNLNVLPGETVANLVIVPIGSDGTVSLFNDAGTTNVVVDVLGYFAS